MRVERTSITDAIIDQLLELIETGSLAPGERVPTESELTSRLGVGRSSVREALKALQALGYVERRNEGTYVRADLDHGVVDRFLRCGFVARRLDVAHLFEARRLLEGEICAHAAVRIDDDAIADLEELCRRMEATPERDFEAFFRLDMAFHQRICEVLANPVLTRLWNVIHDLLEANRTGIERGAEIRQQSNRNHARLLAAFARRDGDAARRAVVAALSAVEALFDGSVERAEA